jgi:hypothetical protein
VVKTQITKAEYYQVVGLLVLARKHDEVMRDIAESVRAIVGEDDDMGHAYDACWDTSIDADDLLRKLKIEVAG